MFFNPEPKDRKEDLFNFERELNAIIRELHDPLSRLIVIKGLRRTGKSSILRVALNESKMSYILIDMREFEDLGKNEFLSELTNALKELIKARHEVIIGRIKAVSLFGVKFELGASDRTGGEINYKKLFRKINTACSRKGIYFVLAIDEAQELAKIGFDKYLAFVYDNLKNIKIIITGSQVGVLNNLLENPSKPLFGRARIDISTRPLPHDMSKRFLKEGFSQLNIQVPDIEIEKAISQFNGIIGWLNLWGWFVAKGYDYTDATNKVIEMGIKLSKDELLKFLETRGVGKKRYIEVLKVLAEGPRRWKEVKTLVEIRLQRRIANNQISRYLNELIKYGFVVKKEGVYSIPDPITAKTVLTEF